MECFHRKNGFFCEKTFGCTGIDFPGNKKTANQLAAPEKIIYRSYHTAFYIEV